MLRLAVEQNAEANDWGERGQGGQFTVGRTLASGGGAGRLTGEEGVLEARVLFLRTESYRVISQFVSDGARTRTGAPTLRPRRSFGVDSLRSTFHPRPATEPSRLTIMIVT